MPTLSCPAAPPCTLVLLIVCKRKSLPWPHLPLRSRLLLPLRGNTPFGSVAPSWLLYLPSNRCGSPNKNMMNAVHPLFTENASKLEVLLNNFKLIVIHSNTFGRAFRLNKIYSYMTIQNNNISSYCHNFL